ncbi:hypothetical protein GGR55DRAFT_80562 [Xylaria sp. FL0064]|nr:hypothetical protein GGR55DRAFT_80562 [Xylaria sp. FL0064]
MDITEEMGNGQGSGQNNTGAGFVAPAQRQAKKRVVTAARKEQNKLAQRAYRKRQREQKKVQKQSAPPGLRRLEPRRDSLETLCESAAVSCSGRNALIENSYHIVNPSSPSTQDGSRTTPDPNCMVLLAMDLQFELDQSSPSSTSRSKVSASSLASMAATLLDGPDIHPPGLINMALGIRGSLEDNSTTVFRACLSNAICIGIDLTELMYCERPCMSPFYRPTAQTNEDPTALVTASSHESLPDSLKPTPAQILIPHHASLDLIPLPRLRERAILMCAALPRTFSLWEMKLDIYTRNALVCQNRSTSSGSVLQPWDMCSWQAAPWFLSKWKAVVDTDEVKTSLSIPGIPGLWM